jgi:hypothetical protein
VDMPLWIGSFEYALMEALVDMPLWRLLWICPCGYALVEALVDRLL